MFLGHIFGLFTNPQREWERIRDERQSIGQAIALVLILAAIPAVSGFIGTTQFGWQFGTSEVVRLTAGSASVIAVLYYAVLVVATLSVGWMIHWMGNTYGARQPLSQCIVLAAYIPIPLFLVGIAQLYPILWLNLIIGIPALSYTIFLLYVGIPVMMQIPQERGFLFASAVLAFGLVGFVGLLAVTVILWGFGVGPVFAGFDALGLAALQ